MLHGGGGVRKVPKTCHILYEWPFYFENVFCFHISVTISTKSYLLDIKHIALILVFLSFTHDVTYYFH
jgi:hypothetical protein